MSNDARRKDEVPEPTPKVPDRATLGIAVLFAVCLAVLLLILFVLPAEYGIDPTRVGRATGISDLYDANHEVSLGDGLGRTHHPEPSAPRNDTVTFQLGPLGDNEYKFHLAANQSFLYEWTASGPVNFEFHGEPDQPDRPGDYSSYQRSQGLNGTGSFQAPFDGRHGWYFQNIGQEPVTITLRTWGYYDVVGLVG